MQFSESWLRSLVNPELTTQQLGHLLTMAGLEVEAIEPAAAPFSQVVVAEIVQAEKHPDADRLQVCQVDVGESALLNIVCGAANARVGLKTACARVGAQLPEFNIKQAKVRGVASFGMLCSTKELGLLGDVDGIMELSADAPVGLGLREFLDLDDQRITLKLTPNRGDCLSIAGIAREVAALTDVALTTVDCSPVSASVPDTYPIVLPAASACPSYCGRVIRGINPKAISPRWMVQRLERSGLRAIHPVVDITNYVMLELGQPMHGFDLARLSGGIQVRMARKDEKLVLLNEQSIEFLSDAAETDVLVVADDSGPLALAGIMGGASSAVTNATCDIFLEAAHFSPNAIVGRARRFGLSTDSSHRFERGVDATLPRRAIERATRLILDVCGGECGPLQEAGSGAEESKAVNFRPARARRILGFELDDAVMLDILKRLGMRLENEAEGIRVTPPSHRFDITREVDLIEEVARVYGYDAIPAVSLRGEHVMLPVGEGVRSTQDVRKLMNARGYQEVITYSFTSEELDRDFRVVGETLPLLNPIASQMGVMRGSLMGGLIQTLRHNLNHGQDRLQIFEAGRVFLTPAATGQPMRLAALAYGSVHKEQWGEKARQADFYDLRADLEALLHPLQVELRRAEHLSLHPGQSAEIFVAGQVVGWLGALHPRLAQKYGFAKSPVLLEVEMAALLQQGVPLYKGMPRFPSVRRDIAVIVDAKVELADMLASVKAVPIALLANIDCFDVYQGQGMDVDKKSLAFNMLLQHTEKTLTDSEIDSAVAEVVDILVKNHNAILRS
ncbi:MAG: phenylalanine--tRNA ligase subunit beta [Hydrogenophilales bacterium 28-61-23]|nr:MAG: phenylalanine--tRNA ligase subunit beta [Hydrogenophilales bacterium 28-61-23]